MSIPYREAYQIGRASYGIEDQQDGKEGHFFPEDRKYRFRVWRNGCGLGGRDTIEEARKLLHNYAVIQLAQERESAQRTVDEAHALLLRLEGDVFYLGRFSK